MPMQRKQIVQAALDILDRDGLEGVTLRRLANELNVKAASIYYHIPDKEALLGDMADAILEEQFGGFDFTDDQQDWEIWLDKLGQTLRRAMLAHREAGRVVAGARFGDMLAKLFDLSIRVLHHAGFDYSKASTVTITVTYFTFGFVIEEQAAPPPIDAPDDIHQPFEQHPTLMAAMEDYMQEDYGIHFDTSMRIIINGARVELQAQSQKTDE